MNNYQQNYYKNGTAYIPINDSPLSIEDINKLNSFCNEVNKEFIEIGDAGEPNHLLVGRFMTDIEEPKKVDNHLSDEVIEILSSKKVIDFIKNVCACKEDIYIRRVQYNEIGENCFVGYHLDKDSNPDYLAAIVLQLGVNFNGGLYRVYNKLNKKKYIDYKPNFGSLLISDCDYPHEVTKVESGKRGSLVFFISKNNGKNPKNNKS
jgi:hypothetical protein